MFNNTEANLSSWKPNLKPTFVKFNPDYLRHLIRVILYNKGEDEIHTHLTSNNCTKWIFPLGMIYSDWAFYVTTAIAIWVVVFGLTGNLLSFVILKRSSGSKNTVIYLCALAIADSFTIVLACVGTYLGLFLKYWNFMYQLNMDKFMLFMSSSPFCQIRIYLSFVSRTISVWIIAAFTLERFIVVYYPFVQRRIRKMHILSVIGGIVATAFTYNITVPLLGFKQKVNKMTKQKLCKSTPFFIKFNFVDMCILSLLPSLVIVTCNILIIVRIRTRQKFANHGIASNQSAVEAQTRQERQEIRLTRRLVAVSTVFVILTMPLFISNFHRNFVSLNCSIKQRIPPLSDVFAVNLMLYNINFSINFILYCLTGKQFRRSVLAIFRCQGLAGMETSFTDQNRRNMATPLPYTNTTGISSRKTSASSNYQFNVGTPSGKFSLNANLAPNKNQEALLTKYMKDKDNEEGRVIILNSAPSKKEFSMKLKKNSRKLKVAEAGEEFMFIDNLDEAAEE